LFSLAVGSLRGRCGGREAVPLCLPRYGWPDTHCIGVARNGNSCEALGYDTFAVSDHFTTAYAPLLVLQLVAICTSTMRLATLVLDNDFRHPAVLAKEAATLDVLSDGRLELTIRSDRIEEFAPVVARLRSR
jgi:Luciferase-like monooxygenase